VVQFKDCIIRPLRGLPLIFAGIHGIALHILHTVVSDVMGFMEDTGAWSELELSTAILFGALPVISAKLEDHHCGEDVSVEMSVN
jgi:hypothetical protein